MAGLQDASNPPEVPQIDRFRVQHFSGPPDDKPVSVPWWTKAAAIQLGPALLPDSCNLPGTRTRRDAACPLFGLAPRGVYPATRIAPGAVRSYRTISPLPGRSPAVCFCGTFREPSLKTAPRPLAGTIPYGDRTFLPAEDDAAAACPADPPGFYH